MALEVSKARAKGTAYEVELLPILRAFFGPQVERAPLKGVQDQGDFTGVPYLHEAKNHLVPHFVEWARVAQRKSPGNWVILWSGGDRRKTTSPGQLVTMPLIKYLDLLDVEADIDDVDLKGL